MLKTDETTQLLSRAAGGDPSATDKLIAVVYDDLRKVARRYLSRERPDHTLQPTALVHDAYLRLVNQKGLDYQSTTHFRALAAREMRRVLIEEARAHKAQKRGGGWVRLELEELGLALEGQAVDVLDLDEALEKLSGLDSRQGRIVELRFYGGLSVPEIASELGVSDSTVKGSFRAAKAWLYKRLRRDRP